MEAGLRLGLGKAEQESFYISAENVTRKRLETEVQADEDYERTLKREVRRLCLSVLFLCMVLPSSKCCLHVSCHESNS